jgi:predicted CoA-substrate-specific enzyme activase
MIAAVGIDVGSTYTKVVVLGDDDERILGQAVLRTGFAPADAADAGLTLALASAELDRDLVGYVVATGYGRFQVPFSHLSVTDLTAAAWGAHALFPGTRTILDVGGQAVRASLVDGERKVRSFRLNEKCAAGTGAFLEKTARYMGFETEQIGPLAATSSNAVPISGVCTVFAEAEVINHLSQGIAPADIMHGAIISLVGKSVQLMKRVKMEPEFTLIGGIMRYPTMVAAVREALGVDVNVPDVDLVQLVGALGAAVLAHRQLGKVSERRAGCGRLEGPLAAGASR